MAKDKILKPFVGIIAPENKFTVDTVDDLKSRNYLITEDVVEVLGYYSKGDRGAHKRIIESTSKVGGIQLVNGLWANVMSNINEVYVEWFGLDVKSDNCSSWFNTAGKFMHENFKITDSFGSGRVGTTDYVLKCFPDYYRCKNTITLSNRIVHDFMGSTFDFNDCADSQGIVMDGRYGGATSGWRVSDVISLRGAVVKGLTKYYQGYFGPDTDFHKPNFMYKAGFYGVVCLGATGLYNVHAHACERGISYTGSDVYLQTVERCSASNNKYALSLDLDDIGNSNENIKILNCIWGNNWTAFIGTSTGAFFSNCSIDYNWFVCEPSKPWRTGNSGTPAGTLVFDKCWFEDTKSVEPVYFCTTQSQVKFNDCYFIIPKKGAFMRAEGPDDLITFNDCLFGDSCPIATEETKLIMRGTTYHKLWSTKGAGKFRKADNLIFNGYMQEGEKTSPTTADGNLIKGWNMKQGETNTSGQTFSTLEYFIDTDGVKKLKMKNGKFRGCLVWTSLFHVRTGEFVTAKAVSDSDYCELNFYDGSKEFISKVYISNLNGVRYHKLQPVPTGATFADIVFANPYYDSSGADEMVVEYCEVNVVS